MKYQSHLGSNYIEINEIVSETMMYVRDVYGLDVASHSTRKQMVEHTRAIMEIENLTMLERQLQLMYVVQSMFRTPDNESELDADVRYFEEKLRRHKEKNRTEEYRLQNVRQGLTKEEADDALVVYHEKRPAEVEIHPDDVKLFLSKFAIHTHTGGVEFFNMHSYQQRAFDLSLTNDVMILSARQMGGSTVAAARMVVEALANPNRNIVLMAEKRMMAEHTFEKIRFALEHMYEKSLKNITDRYTRDYIKFINGSSIRIQSLDHNPRMYQSDIDLLVVDNAGYVNPRDLETLYGQVVPSVQRHGGRIMMLSAAGGRNEMFYRDWLQMFESDRDRGAPVAVRWPWWTNSERDEEFLDREREYMGADAFKMYHECELTLTNYDGVEYRISTEKLDPRDAKKQAKEVEFRESPDMSFGADGTKLYVRNGDETSVFNLSTPYDLGTQSLEYVESPDFAGHFNCPYVPEEVGKQEPEELPLDSSLNDLVELKNPSRFV